jgi:hypothetical protein
MTRSVTILGTVHQIQGAENSPRKQIEDPCYLTLVDQFLKGRDFAFEEASERGPTKLERRAAELLGIGHYLDLDPHPDKREALGIGPTGGRIIAVNPMGQFSDFYSEEFESEHSKREDLWLKRITSTDFEAALFICGFLHALSMAGKLRLAGIDVDTWTYVPYLRLCLASLTSALTG